MNLVPEENAVERNEQAARRANAVNTSNITGYGGRPLASVPQPPSSEQLEQQRIVKGE